MGHRKQQKECSGLHYILLLHGCVQYQAV